MTRSGTSAYRGRGDFRSGPAPVLAQVVVAGIFAAGAVMTWRAGGWSWVSIGLAGGTVAGLAAIVEALVLRVQLTGDAIIVTDLRGRRQYARADISAVEEARGEPTVLVLADGRVVKLPAVGRSVGNSIRAWLAHPAP